MSEQEFINAINNLGIKTDEEKLKKLEKYYNLLVEGNQKMNLTTIIAKEDVYLKHFYDSLTIFKIINLNEYDTFCDVGTGAGLPGIVIKIFFPHLKITLIESMQKRVNFLKEVVLKLDLKDIEVINARVEEYAIKNKEKYDIVTSRAVANINVLLEYNIPITKINGYFVAMKGKEEQISSNALSLLNTKLLKKDSFYLPNDMGERTLYLFLKEKETSKKFPRKYSEIKRKNL